MKTVGFADMKKGLKENFQPAFDTFQLFLQYLAPKNNQSPAENKIYSICWVRLSCKRKEVA